MNEYEAIKEKLRNELEETVKIILRFFPNKEGFEYDIIQHIAVTRLHEIQVDAEQMSYIDFYKKHLNYTLFLDSDDFTVSEREKIIKESPLSERDRSLALAYWVDMKSEDNISLDLGIDRKTVRNNIPKISLILKRTAMILYKK